MPALSMRSPMTRVALGLGVSVLALVLLVQGLLMLAVDGVTDDYVRRFMRGTVDMLQHELAPLAPEQRARRVQVLDQLFAYPVTLVPASGLRHEDLVTLSRGELVVQGFNRRIYASLPGLNEAGGQVLLLGPLNADGHPAGQLQVPRELWLQLAASVLLGLAVFALAAWLLRPVWRDMRALQLAAEGMTAGRFDITIREPESRLFAPLAAGARATLERLATALATQRELTGAVSHELRTPLARLRFAIDALVDEDDAGRRELAVQACERDIDELDALIDASLMLARLDMGALEVSKTPGDLAALLQQEAASLAPLLDGKQLSTDIHLGSQSLHFDARLLPYALRNGLRNAARHARERICLSAWQDEAGRICLAVDDDGEGVPEALREAVFTPFKRLDGPKERGSRGFGLGLAIVRRVAEGLGGEALMQQAPSLAGARLLMRWPDGQ